VRLGKTQSKLFLNLSVQKKIGNNSVKVIPKHGSSVRGWESLGQSCSETRQCSVRLGKTQSKLFLNLSVQKEIGKNSVKVIPKLVNSVRGWESLGQSYS
ncbi:hypothetical protein, partial [Pseudoneobacillus sp. C159]